MTAMLRPEEHVGLLYLLAKEAGRRYRKDPHELASHGALGLMRAARTYDPASGASPATWVSQCVRSEMLNGEIDRGSRLPLFGPGGRERRRNWRSDDLPRRESIDLSRLPRERDPASEAAARDEASRLRAVVGWLHCRRQRLCLRLHYWRGWSQAAIGRAIGVSETRVRQVIAAGLEQVRSMLVGREAIR